MVFDFENGIPEELTFQGGKIEITQSFAKQGSDSLRWDFEQGDSLVFSCDIGYRENSAVVNDCREYVFGIYLFGFGAQGQLWFSFQKEGVEVVGFQVILGFRGWRSVMACFDRDMIGKAQEGMNQLVITAMDSGSLLLDELVTAARYDKRLVMKSYQVPGIQSALPFVHEWKLPVKYYRNDNHEWAIELIKNKVQFYLKAEFLDKRQKTQEDLQLRIGTLAFRNDGLEVGFSQEYDRFGICGKRIEIQQQRDLLKDDGYDLEEYASVRSVTELLLDLAVYCRNCKSIWAEKQYILVLKYLIDQGFAEGSSFGTHTILDYGLRPLYPSIMLMQNEIKKAGLLPEIVAAMKWFLHFAYMGFAEAIPSKTASTDYFFNSAQGMLFAILLMEDSREQTAYLNRYKEWLDENMVYTEGLAGRFKEDGCIYHHHNHYIAYGHGMLMGLAPILYLLTDTPFVVSSTSMEHMQHILDSLQFQCWGEEIPVALSGRHPTGKITLSELPFHYFGMCGFRDWRFEGFKKGDMAEGSRSFPMACATVHRRKGFLALAKGFSRYLWGSEIYHGCNLYGRYRSYGALELFCDVKDGDAGNFDAKDVGDNGFAYDGFDWNRFPGTTTIHLPYNKLEARIYNVDPESGFEECLLSDQSFAGGMSLGGNGMFSMILKEHPKYEGTHVAHKSYFFYDDFILCLGSGICNDSDYETETTLFQDSVAAGGKGARLNGREFQGVFVAQENDIITDTRGNRYYLKNGSKVMMECVKQTSPDSTGNGWKEGLFATAVICHGSRPENTAYEYGIGINGSKRKAYEVIQQDEIAHVVRIGTLTYYAVFKPEQFETVKSNVPIMLMTDEKKDRVEIAFCNPDLGLYEQDLSQYDENGVRKEVSIYSRKWNHTPVQSKCVELAFPEWNCLVKMWVKGGSVNHVSVEKRTFC